MKDYGEINDFVQCPFEFGENVSQISLDIPSKFHCGGWEFFLRNPHAVKCIMIFIV